MPFVITTGHTPRFGTSYYAGPVEAMQMASASRQRNLLRVTDIDEATRIPAIFRQQAEATAAELRKSGYPANMIYDTPKPLKALKWLCGLK